MYDTTRLAIALRMSRAVTRMTQQELAKELAVSKTVIARNEKPDMAMRADTLMRLVYVMNANGIQVDVFSTLDQVELYVWGEDLSSISMRVARAALNLNQQEFADLIGVPKVRVTRGERPGSSVRADVHGLLREKMRQEGVTIEWSPTTQELAVTVHPQALQRQEALRKGESLPGEPDEDLVPTPLHEKLSNDALPRYRTEKRNTGLKPPSSPDKT
ncbi:hypothetical protein P1P91_05975 [Halomonas piscis]|uniref:XRE family transcriptional regulator n=1 Tax=Halomonas piscis TaxID=3031727 RepID=A0ABY9Z3K7_9GAMM|nr:hypothetical protein [Halomonas piscis]WNK21220.1 hypothetical protein P1P91_05975 [Halomonas piscis]